MTDPITIERAEIAEIVRNTIDQTLTEPGIKHKIFNPWMSQNQAAKQIGYTRLYKAMAQGIIEWKKPDMDKRFGRVYVSRKDVQKLLNEPIK